MIPIILIQTPFLISDR